MILKLRQYLLSIIVAAILCTTMKALTQKSSAASAIINLIAGIFLIVTVVSPWSNLSFADIAEYVQDFRLSADAAVEYGTSAANQEVAAIIKHKSEAYILDKAASLGLTLQAEVSLSDTSPPIPLSVILTGSASPYAQKRLSDYITDDLGIPEVNQLWN